MTELLLPQSVQRNIGDKLYDKRKQAALDVEQVVKGLAASGNRPRIQSLIDKLVHEYTFSPQANLRKCLPPEFAKEFLPQIVRPVLHSFKDQDHRVRYYGCEALYNIAKVAQEALIFHFQAVFEGVFKLYADSEPQVQEAAKILDNLVKDIVTACSDFDIREFIPMLKRCLTVVDSHKRQFLISWVRALDSVPDMDLLAWLPELLHGLFAMLADLSREIRHQASKVLQEFLCQLPAAPTVNFQALTPIVVEEACSTNDFVHLTALKWLQVFVEEAPRSMVQQVAPMLGVVMPSVSSSNREIRDAASQVSSSLLRALTAVTSAVSSTAPDATAQELDMVAVLKVVSHELQSKHEASRLEALRWLQFLLQLRQAAVVQELPLLVPALLDALTASSERVVNESLAVQAAIAEDDVHFRDLLFNLISRFRGQGGPALLQARGMLVVRRLAALLGGRRVYEALACILESEPDRQFASLMVQALNLILLTAPELQGLRMMLRGAMHQKDGADLLKALYRCWSQNAGSLIALCLLAQAYQHACDLLHSFADLPITSNLLVQLDRLVQLLETPAFTQMRLHLLQPAQQPALVRALYALLMLLPQSAAFRTLHSRLDAVPTVALMQLTHASSGGAVPDGAGVPPASSSPAASTLPAKHSARELPAANALGVGLNGDDGIDFAELLQVFRMQQRQVSGPGYIATSPSSCSLLISPQESGEDATS